MTETEFAKSWNGILFVINDDSLKVQATFAASSELALAPGGRITLTMEPVSQAALALTRPTLGDL